MVLVGNQTFMCVLAAQLSEPAALIPFHMLATSRTEAMLIYGFVYGLCRQLRHWSLQL